MMAPGLADPLPSYSHSAGQPGGGEGGRARPWEQGGGKGEYRKGRKSKPSVKQPRKSNGTHFFRAGGVAPAPTRFFLPT